MAVSVETMFSIKDQVSDKLKMISNNAIALGSSLNDVKRTSRGALNPVAPRDYADALERVGKNADKTGKNLNSIGNSVNETKQSFLGLSSASGAFVGKLAKGAALMFALKKAAEGLTALAGFSDEMALLNSRLLLATDSEHTLLDTQNMIRKKAQETKMDYMLLAETVGKIGIGAKDAFKSTEEAVNFTGALNQSFMLGGASAEETAGATRQLTQALASGVLRGDELNSVMENAPLIAEAISKKLGITKGEIRQLASEGKLTSDIVKNAILENADDIAKRFQQMNGTLSGTIKNGLKNTLVTAFQEPASALNALFNSEAFMSAANGFITIVGATAKGVTVLINVTSAGLNLLVGIWHSVGSEVIWVGAVVGVAFGVRTIHTLGLVGKSVTALKVGMRLFGLTSIRTAITCGSAWLAVNAPFLIIGATVVGLIYMAKKMGVTFEDVAGVVGGAFGAIGAIGKNVVIGLAKILGFFFNSILNKLKLVVSVAEKVSSAITGKEVRFGLAHDALDLGDSLVNKIQGIEFASVGAGYKKGSAKGKSAWNKVTSFMDPMGAKVGETKYGGGLGLVKDDDEAKSKLGKIKDNTDSMKASLSEGIETLSFLTKSALSNRITVINNNNKLDVKTEITSPDSSFDVDGWGNSLGNSMLDAINSGSGGVPNLV